MKQTLMVLLWGLALLNTISLTACEGHRETALGVFYNIETGVPLSLGMPKDKVEEGLSKEYTYKSESPSMRWYINYGKDENYLQIGYDWDTCTVVDITISEFPSNWVLDNVISGESSIKDVESFYGTPTFQNGVNAYYYEDGTTAYGKLLSYTYANGAQTDGNDVDMVLNFAWDPYGRLDSISVYKPE